MSSKDSYGTRPILVLVSWYVLLDMKFELVMLVVQSRTRVFPDILARHYMLMDPEWKCRHRRDEARSNPLFSNLRANVPRMIGVLLHEDLCDKHEVAVIKASPER